MITIYKYELAVVDEQTISADIVRFLDIQIQHGVVCLWALVDNSPHPHMPNHLITIFGTGHPFPIKILSTHEFLSTIQLPGVNFVGHVFVPRL